MEGGIRGKNLPIAEVAESLSVHSLHGKALDDRGEPGHGVIDRDARREEAIESGAVVLRSQVECVLTGSLTDETDLR